MGTCEVCGKLTRRKYYHLCGQHYWFDFKGIRFWATLLVTGIWELVLSLPLIDEDGVRAWFMKSAWEATNNPLFLFGWILIEIAIFMGSFLAINVFLHKGGVPNRPWQSKSVL